MKIFIGLTEIAGYYSNLKKGFEELEIPATFVDLEYHPFKYDSHDVPNILVRLATFVSRKRSHTPRSKLPIVNATEDTLGEVLEGLLTDGARRYELGVRGRAFVEKYHDALKVASELVAIYEAVLLRHRRRVGV